MGEIFLLVYVHMVWCLEEMTFSHQVLGSSHWEYHCSSLVGVSGEGSWGGGVDCVGCALTGVYEAYLVGVEHEDCCSLRKLEKIGA